MASAIEAAQDLTRAMRALVKARLHLAALDVADARRKGQSEVTHPSALHQELELAEAAGERVFAYLVDLDPVAATLWPDGGQL